MGELYNPYPKLPKNIRQIGERDQIVKLYVEDYVNTYLKRLYPAGGQDLRVGILLGEVRSQDGTPYLFVDGALEMEGVTQDGEKVVFTEEAWKQAYQAMEQSFPRRNVLGWFLCGAPGSSLSPLNYWKQHGQYFSGKNQLMYLNSGLEGEEALYVASEDGFYKLRGYCIYYERNQMMQDYMVSRKDARRVETGTRDVVIRDFRQRMEDKKEEAVRRRSTVSTLGTACGVLSVMVLAGGVVMFNNYHKMKAMESVITSVVPEGTGGSRDWSDLLSKGPEGAAGNRDKSGAELSGEDGELIIEEVPGEVYPTLAEIVIDPNGDHAAEAGAPGGKGTAAGASNGGMSGGNGTAAGASNGGMSGGKGTAAGASSAGTSADNGTAAETQPVRRVEAPASAVPYIVKNGETLYGICMEHYGSMADMETICLWNGLGDGSRITAGQEILVPPMPDAEKSTE
ncbi:MAG: LysM domain-containing protein [Eubacteriales bacterium]|nr:LysM domain-containing protein [Eubacteriales bacterium]